MRKVMSLLSLGCALLMFSCATHEAQQSSISVRQVLNNSERLNGKEVTVKGYLVFDIENRSLYFSRNAYRYGSYQEDGYVADCISLDLTDAHRAKWYDDDHRIVLVKGVVDAKFCSEEDVCIGFCNAVGLVDVTIYD